MLLLRLADAVGHSAYLVGGLHEPGGESGMLSGQACSMVTRLHYYFSGSEQGGGRLGDGGDGAGRLQRCGAHLLCDRSSSFTGTFLFGVPVAPML